MLKLPPPLQELIHDGQCLFLFGPDPIELGQAVKELCAMHGQAPYWVMVGNPELTGGEIPGIPLMACQDGDAQSKLMMSAARQDPDAVLPIPLYPEAIENFFRLIISGSNVASYAVLPFEKIEEFIAECRKRQIADEITHAICDDFLFVELKQGYRNAYEVELVDGLVDVWVTEELENQEASELTAKAAPPPWQPQPMDRDIIETWLQERSSQDLSTVQKFERPAWIPNTIRLSDEHIQAIETYQNTLGLGSMILQIAIDQLPAGVPHNFPKGSFVQIFRGGEAEDDIDPKLKILTRAELKNLPAATHFRGLFQLETWLEVKDYPHGEDFEKLQIPFDPDADRVNACFPLTKFGGWPAWLQGSEQNPASDKLFCQIDSMIGEFELFLGADLNAYLFVKSDKDLTAVIQSS